MTAKYYNFEYFSLTSSRNLISYSPDVSPHEAENWLQNALDENSYNCRVTIAGARDLYLIHIKVISDCSSDGLKFKVSKLLSEITWAVKNISSQVSWKCGRILVKMPNGTIWFTSGDECNRCISCYEEKKVFTLPNQFRIEVEDFIFNYWDAEEPLEMKTLIFREENKDLVFLLLHLNNPMMCYFYDNLNAWLPIMRAEGGSLFFLNSDGKKKEWRYSTKYNGIISVEYDVDGFPSRVLIPHDNGLKYDLEEDVYYVQFTRVRLKAQ